MGYCMKIKALFIRLASLLRRPAFWLIFGLLLLISIPHYQEFLKNPPFITSLLAALQLERQAFERILYLIPIIWSGFLFGYTGARITSVVALVLMLPRALFISDFHIDAIYETVTVVIVGNLFALSFRALRRVRMQNVQIKEDRDELQRLYQEQKIITDELRLSEHKYREIFENANDAIWLHDSDGNIINANQASEKLTGYSTQELLKMNMSTLYGLEHFESIEQPHEKSIIRKDGSEVIIDVTTSQVMVDKQTLACQHIARDVSEERRIKQHLYNYVQQVTRAQEEERKRISRELHDDTIQSLVVLSRRLDSLASRNNDLSDKTRLQLEELRQQTNNIMGEVRRLSQDLRPVTLDGLGLLSALRWLAADVEQHSGIATQVKVTGTENRLPEEIELVLFRITQEALRNVWRHSKATQADITIEYNEKNTRIGIHDNGIGFDVQKKLTGTLTKDGKLGLTGMQERAKLIGGILSIQSEPGNGCTVTIEASTDR